MADNAELQAKIAAISGQINKHKQHQPTLSTTAPPYQQPRQHLPPHQPRRRWSPYARGGRAGYPQQHKNRTLVLSGNQSSPPRASEATLRDEEISADSSTPVGTFVTAHDFGKKQLISKDTFDREQKQKETARAAKRQKIDLDERSTLMHHAKTSSAFSHRELVIDGIRFQLRDDGSKLIRILDASSASRETPKQARIADVVFHRTKNGNLVRANAVRELLRYRHYNKDAVSDQDLFSHNDRTTTRKEKPQCEHFTKHGIELPFMLPTRPRTKLRVHGKSSLYTTNAFSGNCPFGPTCKFSHDPNKVAICKTFLRSGSCPDGDSCDLSHVPSYHRVPACTHFLRGNCTKDACLYAHVHVSFSALVCRPFASLGYCNDGENCTKRHVFECPDYANTGFCANRESGKCTLPHPDRAGVLRKAAARQAKTGSGNESDVSSDEEEKNGSSSLDDIDSDEAEDVIMGGMDNDHALTQQQDFIALT